MCMAQKARQEKAAYKAWQKGMLDPNSSANINNKPNIKYYHPNDNSVVSQQVVAQPSMAEDSVEPTNKARKKVKGFNDLISSLKSGTLLGGLIGGKNTLG